MNFDTPIHYCCPCHPPKKSGTLKIQINLFSHVTQIDENAKASSSGLLYFKWPRLKNVQFEKWRFNKPPPSNIKSHIKCQVRIRFLITNRWYQDRLIILPKFWFTKSSSTGVKGCFKIDIKFTRLRRMPCHDLLIVIVLVWFFSRIFLLKIKIGPPNFVNL